MHVLYIIYADFEALNYELKSIKNIISNYTHQISKQVPCSYYCIIVRRDGVVNEPVLYRGEDTVENVLTTMQTEFH